MSNQSFSKQSQSLDISVDTEKFWDGVSKMYSSSDMTHHMADFELGQVLSVVDKMNLKGLSCFGVADGNRDPIQILDHCYKNNKELPSELFINDISSNMLKESISNLKIGGWLDKIKWVIPIHNSISKINFTSNIINKKSTYIIGVYNADYLRESLLLYKENKDVIGKHFTICPLYLDQSQESPSIYKGKDITFDIDNYENYTDILDVMKQDSNFYAYSVLTDKNFISHYFNAKALNSLISSIYKKHNISTQKGENQSDKRYIVNVIRSNNGTNDYVVTMLNNVFGNIKFCEHVDSLQKLYDLHHN